MRTAFLGPLLAASLLGGCPGTHCTLVGCVSTFELELDRGAWPDGAYEITLSLSGSDDVTCAFELPLSDEAGCDRLNVGLDGDTLLVWRSLDTGEPNAPTVEVRLTQDGDELLDDTVDATWDEPYYPNGEECGPACTSGSAAVVIDG